MEEETHELAVTIITWHAAKIQHLKDVQGKLAAGVLVRCDDNDIVLTEEFAQMMQLGMEACIVELEELPFELDTGEPVH